jgi:xanthine/uracil permease
MAAAEGYILLMETFFPIAIVGAMIAAVGALLLGIVSMAKGGEFSKKYGNKLMRARVALQGLAILLFIVFMLTYRS